MAIAFAIQSVYEIRRCLMKWLIWVIIMAPCSAVLSGLGIFAWRRKKPMWFWSGSVVEEDEISDIPAYNRANGIMWIVFSLIFWSSTILGIFNMKGAGILLFLGCVPGIIILPIVYGRIYDRYASHKKENKI